MATTFRLQSERAVDDPVTMRTIGTVAADRKGLGNLTALLERASSFGYDRRGKVLLNSPISSL